MNKLAKMTLGNSPGAEPAHGAHRRQWYRLVVQARHPDRDPGAPGLSWCWMAT